VYVDHDPFVVGYGRSHLASDGLGEVQRAGRGGEHVLGPVQVGLGEVGHALRPAGEMTAPVAHHERIMIHVHNARLCCGALRDLVGVARRGQACPDVEELPDAGLAR
jgi:hypothetical protein